MSSGPTREEAPHNDQTRKDKRITRNWTELLQELRVTQTGVQVLTGFLLTVPFSSRFPHLTQLQRVTYLCIVLGAIIATALLVAPVAFHRVLFHQRRRPWLVSAAHACAAAGLAVFSLVCAGAAFLVFDIATSTRLASIVGVALLLVFGVLWAVVPLASEAHHRQTHDAAIRN